MMRANLDAVPRHIRITWTDKEPPRGRRSGRKEVRPLERFDDTGAVVHRFESVTEAEERGFVRGSIAKAARSGALYMGTYWRYI